MNAYERNQKERIDIYRQLMRKNVLGNLALTQHIKNQRETANNPPNNFV